MRFRTMKNTFAIASIVAFLHFLGAASGEALAQVGHDETSLEGHAAQAEVIVRARVARVMRGQKQETHWTEAVTLAVTETLRGPAKKILTFAHSYSFETDVFQAWKEARCEHLYFFVRNAQYREDAGLDELEASYPLSLDRVVRLGPIVPAEKLHGPPGQGLWRLPLFTNDLKVVAEPEAILGATRAAVAEQRGRGKVEMHRIDLPGIVMSRVGTSGDVNCLQVPVDRHLEDLARRIIGSPGDYVKPSDFRPAKDEEARKNTERWLGFSRDLLRAEAVKALVYFKSDENIALIKPLLADPAALGVTRYEGGKPIDLGREYYIRKAAYEVLRSWGVAVAEPVIFEKPDGHESHPDGKPE